MTPPERPEAMNFMTAPGSFNTSGHEQEPVDSDPVFGFILSTKERILEAALAYPGAGAQLGVAAEAARLRVADNCSGTPPT
jgi:hypothetical protein